MDQASAIDKDCSGDERSLYCIYSLFVSIFCVQNHLQKKRNMHVRKPFQSNFSSNMFFKCDICKDKSWMLHLPTTLANHSFGTQLVQESYLIFHHCPLCNGTSFNPLLCAGFKVLCVMVSRSSPNDLTSVQTGSLHISQIGMGF